MGYNSVRFLTKLAEFMYVCNRRVSDANLEVSFADIPTALTDKRRIILPSKIKEDPNYLERAYGYLVHEIGHNLRVEAFDLLQTVKTKELAGIYNLVEDHFMESEQAAKFMGDQKILSRGLTQHAYHMLKDLGDDGYDELAVAAWMTVHRGRWWDNRMQLMVDEYEQRVTPATKHIYKELCDEGWPDKFARFATVKESFDLAVDYYGRLYPNASTPEEREQIKQKGQDKLDGKDDGSPVDVGIAEDGDKVKPDDKDKDGKPADISWEDLVHSHHKEQELRPAGGVDWEDYEEGSEKIGSEYEQIREIKYRERGHTAIVSSNLAGQIRVYLQSLKRNKIVPEQQAGKIYKRNLVRLTMPPIDKGRWNKRVFYTQHNRIDINTCVMLLMDGSSSMYGDKMTNAKEAVVQLSHVLDSIRVPYSVAAFNSSGGHNIHCIKEFSDRVNCHAVYTRLAVARLGGGNNDSDSIMWAYNRLRQRREERRILIVLSDGMPSAGRWAAESLLRINRELESHPNYDLYGIGIKDRSVQKYYRNNVTIESSQTIERALLSVLKNALKGGY